MSLPTRRDGESNAAFLARSKAYFKYNGRIPKEDYYGFLANNGLVGTHINSKRKRVKKTYKKRARRRLNSSGAVAGTRPIIMQPSIVGYGAYGPGGAIGEQLGSWAGGKLGGMAGDALGTIFGFGDYTINSNSLWNSEAINAGTNPPKVINTHKGEAFIVNHREYLKELVSGPMSVVNPSSGTLFQLETIALNPGNSDLFPWLSQLASNFQEYEIRGMIVELKTEAADYSSNFNIGAMFMSADYNVLNPAPVNKRELENQEYATSSKPSNSLIYGVECAPSLTSTPHLFVCQNREYPAGADKRLYDLCNLHIGSQGLPAANTVIAEIWVSFEVALFKPILANIDDQAIGAHFTLSDCTTVEPFNGHIARPNNRGDFAILNPHPDTIQLPDEVGIEYLIVCSWHSSDSHPFVWGNPISTSGCTILSNMWADNSGIDANNVTDATGYPTNGLVAAFNVVTTGGVGPGGTIVNFGSCVTMPTGHVYGDIYITMLPHGLNS